MMVAGAVLGRVREAAFLPDVSEVRFSTRGFGPWALWWQHPRRADGDVDAKVTRLEAVGESFLAGLRAALRSRDNDALGNELEERIERRFRGFAYEGAAMGLALIDGLRVWGDVRTPGFLAGPANAHIYMAHVGIGWAMARLPRRLWRRIRPHDPLLRWLALDGYGFHQAYFRTDQYVRQQRGNRELPGWGRTDAVRSVVDQGVGRALWFVDAACVEALGHMIHGFDESRQPDLFSGAGLAATYAGGADEEELRRLRTLAGPHRADVAQGAAFAAKARERSGLVTEENETAARILCGCSLSRAAEITDEALRGVSTYDETTPTGTGVHEASAYETWRGRIRDLLLPNANDTDSTRSDSLRARGI